jgi:sugar phosphate isomerase/epimerase
MKTVFLRIQFLFATTGIIMLSTGLMSCDTTPKKKDIGLQLYSVRADMNKDVKGTIEKVGQMGYTFVEAAGYSNGQFYGMEPAAFKALVEANGMKLLGSHSGPHLTADSASMEMALAEWDNIIAAHKAAGVKYIVKPSMGGYSYSSLEGLTKTCEYFNAIGEKCNAAGIRFGYHNHAKEFTELEGQIIYDYMLQNTDPDKVMYQLDLYWIYKGGKSAVDYFNKYPGRFENWHVKDVAELGASGEIDFEPIFNEAKTAGVEDLVVEVEEYNFEPLVSVEKSLAFLKEAPYVK